VRKGGRKCTYLFSSCIYIYIYADSDQDAANKSACLRYCKHSEWEYARTLRVKHKNTHALTYKTEERDVARPRAMRLMVSRKTQMLAAPLMGMAREQRSGGPAAQWPARPKRKPARRAAVLPGVALLQLLRICT
jgi:hypothetical protein